MMRSVRHWWHQRNGAGAGLREGAVAANPRMRIEVAFATGPAGLPFGAGGPAIKLNRANGGRKPVRVELLVVDDLTQSAHNRAAVICETTRSAFEALEQTALEARFGYLGSRDRGHGEADELRVVHGTAAQVLREQMTVTRAGGGDAAETFGDTLLDALDGYPFTHAPDVVGAVLLLCTDDSKPTLAGLSMEAVGERCRLARKHVFVVGEPGSNTEAIVLGAGAFGGGFLPLKANPTPQEVQLIARRLTGTLVGSLNQVATGTVPASALVPTGFTVPGP